MKNIACLIARTNSTRLKQKALVQVNGLAMTEYIICNLKKAKLVDDIYVCTSTEKNDRALLAMAHRNGVKGYAGSPESPIERMLAVGRQEKAANLIRVTGDNVFTDPGFIDLMLHYHIKNRMEYTRTELLPLGVTAEVISLSALQKCNGMIAPSYTEYLFLYMFQPARFKCQVLIPPAPYRRQNWTLTVDTAKDLRRTKNIVRHSHKQTLNYLDILGICQRHAIADIQLDLTAGVNFPAGVQLSHEAFMLEKKMRVKGSHKVALSINEIKAAYEN
jgi:spore coat polysaccharide biosynthesis protein SpsF